MVFNPFEIFTSAKNMLILPCSQTQGEIKMLGWVILFLIIALIAGLLGFTTVAGAAIGIAKFIFFIFLILFIIALIMHIMRGKGGPRPPAV